MIKTNGDVKAAIARAGVKQGDVARQMGIDPASFSRQTKDLKGKPSPTFAAQVEDAIEVIANGITTA